MELVDININQKSKAQERNGLHLMSLNTIPDGATPDIYEYIMKSQISLAQWCRIFDITLFTGLLRKIYLLRKPKFISFPERPSKG